MEKHSVNLVIRRPSEPPVLAKLRIYLPVFATAGLLLFIVSFLASIIYVGNNSQQYNALTSQIATLENKIASAKNTEGIYTLTYLRINTIKQLTAGSKNYIRLLTEIFKLRSDGISISQTSVDTKNTVSLTVTASSSATLDGFVTELLAADAAKVYSNIQSSGIVRDKNGSYLLTISLKPYNSILQ